MIDEPQIDLMTEPSRAAPAPELPAAWNAWGDLEPFIREFHPRWEPAGQVVQRRQFARIEFVQPLLVYPCTEEGDRDGEPWWATGKNISLWGVCFAHLQPLPQIRVQLVFMTRSGPSPALSARLLRCRYTRRGTYESGGKFLRPLH